MTGCREAAHCRRGVLNAGVEKIRFAVLDPILNVQFDKADKPGRYQMQALVTDAAQNTFQTVTEWFELVP